MRSLQEMFEEGHKPASGRTLIVGSNLYTTEKEDRRLRYQNVIGVDQIEGNGVDRVLDMEKALPKDFGLFSHIECCSVLEHSKRPWLIASNIQRALVKGGTLFVTVPFVWRVHSYPSDYWRFTREAVRLIFPKIQWHELIYAHINLDKKGLIPKLMPVDGPPHPHLARTEIFGFGERQ